MHQIHMNDICVIASGKKKKKKKDRGGPKADLAGRTCQGDVLEKLPLYCMSHRVCHTYTLI